jgi:hypothetical protein
MDATRRARERALQSLKQLQAEAAAAPAEPDPLPEPPEPPAAPSLCPSTQTTKPVIGFVLPTPSAQRGTDAFACQPCDLTVASPTDVPLCHGTSSTPPAPLDPGPCPQGLH